MEDVFDGAIGIDLGTTYSCVGSSFVCRGSILTIFHRCVGVWQNERVEIIANDRELPFYHHLKMF